MSAEPITLLMAGAVRDAAEVDARPGAIAFAGGRVLAAGAPRAVRLACGGRPIARTVSRPDSLILPSLVNAHAHLDLSTIGPVPFSGSFTEWVGFVMRERPADDGAIAAAVHRGLERSRAAGVGWIADIAGTAAAVRARFSAPAAVPGCSFVECFGIGRAAADAGRSARAICDGLRAALSPQGAPTGIGLQPHAPYSAGPELYAAAARDDGLASTHLAETEDELEFVARASGPLAELLRRLDKWDDSIAPSGLSPVAALQPHLGRGRWILAHCNYLDDDDIDRLARMRGASVAFCPIASEYFGHSGHRYRDLSAAGVNVCLGTDSVLCQPAAEPQPFGILPQMRRLYVRDGTDPALLLALATTNGLRALGLRPSAATLGPGAPARPIAVRFDPADPRDALAQILEDGPPAEPVTLD